MAIHRQKSDTHLDNTAGDNSRYRLTNVHIDAEIREGARRYGLWQKPEIDESDIEDWNKHTVSRTDQLRLDSIANKYYPGRPDYWWAIALVNDIQNPLEDVAIGDTLYIPPQELIEAALGQQ